MADGCTTRPPRPGEGRAIAELKRRSWQVGYRGQLPDELLDGLDLHPAPEVYEQPARDGSGHLVGAAGDDVLGVAGHGPARDDDCGPDVGELVMLYVDPPAWGTGVGHDLHEAVLDALRAAGCTRAVLWVLEGNARAIRFYEAHGWQRDGTTKLEPLRGEELLEVRYARSL